MKDYIKEAEETLDKVVEEVETGELFFQFSIGYSWDESPTDHDQMHNRQAALQAVTSILNAHMDEIMAAARDAAQKHIDEWTDSDKTDQLASAALLLEMLDNTVKEANNAKLN